MRDILENISSMDERIKKEEERKELAKATKKLIKEEFLDDRATSFAVKYKSLEEDKYVKENILGKFCYVGSDLNDRVENVILAIDTLHKMSKDENNTEIVSGHPLFVDDAYRSRLIKTARGMYKELHDTNMKNDMFDQYRTTETQAFLNDLCITRKGNDATEGTARNHRLRIQKLNLIEAVANGKFSDYSSGIQTKYEIAERNNLPKKEPKDEPNKQFRREDYERAKEGIMTKFRKNPEKVTDAEVTFLLAGGFMLRKSTVGKLTVENIDPRSGQIEVYPDQNKSKQAFIATGSFTTPQLEEHTEVLSLIKQRAKLRYSDRPNKDGTIPITVCSEQYLYKGMNKILRDYDIKGEWKGKYHALRYMEAQARYDEIRGAMETYYPNKTEMEWKMAALKELNYEMGHGPDQLETTMGYVKNIW